MKELFAIAAITMLALTLSAPTRAENQGVPASSNVPGTQTPSIDSDQRISFSLKAPDATSLQVEGGDGLGMGPFPMTKGSDGTWSVTTPPSVPGFHYYWFVLNGVAVNDPASETYFGYGKETSGIEVPENGADFYTIQNVPHGEVRAKWYLSKTTGEWRRAFVYTPPGYDAHPTTRYPVLILQHGSGEDETGWTRQGRAQFILDNLIAAGKTRPMILVMDRGYAWPAGAPTMKQGPAEWLQGQTAFEDVVVRDLIPMIDASYRTIPDREHRAMAGLSMGGMQTMFIALEHLELFAYIGSFSGSIVPNVRDVILNRGREPFDAKTAYGGVLADPYVFNKRVKLLWLGVGTAEADDFRADVDDLIKGLRKAGVRLEYFESSGTAHEWQTWRRHLNNFVPLLFR